MDIVLQALLLVGVLCVVCVLATMALDWIAACFDDWKAEE